MPLSVGDKLEGYEILALISKGVRARFIELATSV
jgi:hypothetical protein